MSWKQPGRARHVVIVSEQGPTQEYSRGERHDDLWYGASGYPNPTVFRSGPTMTSAALAKAITAAIEAGELTADPIDPGAMPVATIGLTSAQLRTLIEATEDHRGSIRIEKLAKDAYARVVLIGPEGEPVAERLLFPV